MMPPTARMLAVLDRLIASGALVERAAGWVRPDGSGAPVRPATMEGLHRRALIITTVTAHGRTATASPFAVARRRRFKARIARARGNIHAEALLSQPL